MSAPARLEWTALEIARSADFFTVATLPTQTGVSEDLWVAMCLKELVDNARDAAEAVDIAPELTVSLERDGDDFVAQGRPGTIGLDNTAFSERVCLDCGIPLPVDLAGYYCEQHGGRRDDDEDDTDSNQPRLFDMPLPADPDRWTW